MNGQPKKYYSLEDIDKITNFYKTQQSEIPFDTPYPVEDIQTDNLKELSGVKESDIFDFLPNVVKKAYNESITGMSQQLITGEKRFNLDAYNPGVTADIGASIMSFFMPADLIATIAGAGVGGVAGKVAAKSALGKAASMGTKRLLRNGTKKELAESVIKSGTEKILTEAGRQSAGFGVYTGIASALKQKIDTDEVDYGDVFTDAAKGSLSAAVGGAVLGRATAKGTAKALAYTQEAAAFGTVDPLLQGRLPDPMDYVSSVGFALGLSGVAGAPGAVKKLNAYKKDFFSKERIGEFDNLSTIDRQKQNNIANVRAEIEWVNSRGLKRWDAISPDASDISFTDVSVIGRQPAKKKSKFKGDSFKIIDNNTQKVKTLTRDSFFKKYKESDKSRIKTEAAIYEIGEELDINIDGELRVFTNDKAKKVSDLNDRDLNNFHQMYFKKYNQSLFRKQFAEYSSDIPQTDFFVHVFGKKVADQLRVSHKTFADRGSQAVVKTLFDVQDGISGFEGKSFVDIGNLKSLINKNKLSKERIWKEASGRETVTNVNRKAVESIQRWANDRFEYGRSGGIIPKGKIEFYLPNMLKAEFKEALFDDYARIEKESFLHFADKFKIDEQSAKVLNRMIENRIRTKQVSSAFDVLMQDIIRQNKKVNRNFSYAEAYSLFRQDIRPNKINPHGQLENKRRFNLPDELLEKDPIKLMAIYDARLGRRVELSKAFGADNVGITKMLSEIGDLKERTRLSTLVDQISGFTEADLSSKRSPEIRRYVQNLMGFEAMTKIAGGDATIANFFQTLISTMPVLGITRTAKGTALMFSKDFRDKLPTVYQDFIRDVIGDASTTSLMRRATEKASKYSGFTGINKFNNMLASATAKIAIDDYSKMYKNNPNSIRGRYAKNKLNKLFNIDIENISDITESKMTSAMASFARKSQLQRDYLREQTWLSNPSIRPFLLFKSFGIKQAGFITEQMTRELKEGNPLIIARLAMGGMAGGFAINYAKNMVSQILSGREFEPKEDTKFNEFVQSIGSVGAFGMLSEFMDAEDLANQIEFTLKPVFYSDLEKAIDAMGEFQRSVDEFGFTPTAFRRSVYKASPILGTNVRRISERFIATEAQKRNAQSSRKGRVRVDAIKLMSEGKSDLAIRRTRQWNKNNPTNPITYEDVSYKEIYKYLMRKHMKVKTEGMNREELEAYREFMEQ
tara:strand:+ start:1287 stop:4862 length:3576 start_codon:yes stop_codon:yes gene_type:complete